MAQPASSHREHGDRHRSDRERERSSSSRHHHRTISSTTLLLVLSLVLAVLAVMLSLPSSQSGSTTAADPNATGILSYLSPKRTQALIAREGAVAVREAEVARREAEMLAGAPGGVLPPAPAPVQICSACPPPSVVTETVAAPAHTIIKETFKEQELTPPGWTGSRAEEILDRELRITERERDISKREESINRREHDASRRESWIMEQLMSIGNEGPIEEEYVYEPAGNKRKAKYQELPPLIVAETAYETRVVTQTQTQTVTVPPPASTRRAPFPTPMSAPSPSTLSSPRTTAIEIITEEEIEEPRETMVKRGNRRAPPREKPWFGW